MDKKRIALLGGIALLVIAVLIAAVTVLGGGSSSEVYKNGPESVEDWEFEGKAGDESDDNLEGNTSEDSLDKDGKSENGSAEGVADDFGEDGNSSNVSDNGKSNASSNGSSNDGSSDKDNGGSNGDGSAGSNGGSGGNLAPNGLSYAEYMAMSGAEQQKWFESFDSLEAFKAWYNKAKAAYDANKDTIENDGSGSIDLGDYTNKG